MLPGCLARVAEGGVAWSLPGFSGPFKVTGFFGVDAVVLVVATWDDTQLDRGTYRYCLILLPAGGFGWVAGYRLVDA